MKQGPIMRFTPTPLEGAYLVDLERREDERGFFARFFCTEEFRNHDLQSQFVQANNSWNACKGTLRGLHYQLPPDQEEKIVRCLRGALFDVILDLRIDSPTFRKWFGAHLTEDNRTMMYVPKGFAHGFVTMKDNTEALYLVSTPYAPSNERGIRWNDPFFNITWPIEPTNISDKDRRHPDFNSYYHLANKECIK